MVDPEIESNRDILLVSALHFHSQGHEGHHVYSGELLGGVEYGDTEASVISKLGLPIREGGGGFSSILNKPVARWLRYPLAADLYQFQFSKNGRVELTTLFVQDRQRAI